MSTNSAILLDPQYLETNYDVKQHYIQPTMTREYVRDSANYKFALFLASWYYTYKLLNTSQHWIPKLIAPTVMSKYLISFTAAFIIKGALLPQRKGDLPELTNKI